MNTTETNANPLTMDFNSVNTQRDLLKCAQGGSFYELRIAKAELQDAADPNKPKMIYLELVNTAPATSTKETPINPGDCTVFHRIMTAPIGKATWKIIGQNIGELVQSIPGGVPGASPNNYPQWVPTLQGKVVRASVKYVPEESKDGKTYREKNEIGYFEKAR